MQGITFDKHANNDYAGSMNDWLQHAYKLLSTGWGAFILLIFLGWIACATLSRVFRRFHMHNHSHRQILNLSVKAIKGIIWALVLIQGLHGVGVDVVGFLGAAGVAGVAIGFASQTALSNLISGAFLVGESSFRMGDYIQVGSEEGTVESINLLSVYLRRADNTLTRVPCETLIKTPVRNLTGAAQRRIDFDLGVDYASDLSIVREIIMNVIANQPLLLDEPAPTITFGNFGDSSLNLHIGAWCKTEHYHAVRYEFATAILAAFAEKNINIPFPIRAVTRYETPSSSNYSATK